MNYSITRITNSDITMTSNSKARELTLIRASGSMAQPISLGTIKPRVVRWITLWEADIRKREHHHFIEAEIVLSCCEIEKAPDLGPNSFRTEVFYRFKNGAGNSKPFTFELDIEALIDDFIKEGEDRKNFSIRFEIFKEFNLTKIDCALFHTVQVQTVDYNKFRGFMSNNPHLL